MLIKPAPIKAFFIAIVQAFRFGHIPIDKWVNVVCLLVSLAFKAVLLIGGDTDKLPYIVLFPKRLQEFLTGSVL